MQYVAAMGADLQEEEDEDEEQVENLSQMHFVNLVKSNWRVNSCEITNLIMVDL